jgi:DNA-directed RNA polymerase specialized sigma24 family protein
MKNRHERRSGRQQLASPAPSGWRNLFENLAPATEAERQWFVDNFGMLADAVRVAAKNVFDKDKFWDWEELVGFAFPFALHALRKFDPTKPGAASLITYFYKAVRNNFTAHLKRMPFFPSTGENVWHRRGAAAPELFGGDFEIEVVEDDEDNGPPPEVLSKVRAAFSELNPNQKRALTMRLGLDGKPAMTAEEIARRRGISKQAVFQTVGYALLRLARAVGHERFQNCATRAMASRKKLVPKSTNDPAPVPNQGEADEKARV